jgi:hypothetical protein
MPETRLNNFRKQYPMYENVPDDSLLTAIHKKSYSNVEYDAFLDAFSKKFGDQARKPDDSYLKGFGEEIGRQLKDFQIPKFLTEDLKFSPTQAIGGAVGLHALKAIDLFTQRVPTALIPSDKQIIGGVDPKTQLGETPAERLKRGKRPGEFFPKDPGLGLLFIGGKSLRSEDAEVALKTVADFGLDLFLALPAVKAISNAFRTGEKVTRVSVNEVRSILRFDQNQKLLRSGAKTKALSPLSDEAIVEVIRRGEAQGARVGGDIIGKETTTPLKQLTPGQTRFQHAEGILESQAKLGALKDVKPRLKTKVTTGR